MRSRRIVVTSALAAGSLLSMYAAALRELPAYAASIVRPIATAGCTAGSTEVSDDTALQAAVLSSADDSVICITSSIVLSAPLVVDDTTLTLEGANGSIALRAPAADRLIYAHFTDAGSDDTLTISTLALLNGAASASAGAGVRVVSDDTLSDDALVLDAAVLLNNSDATEGGAVYASQLNSVSIVDSLFQQNYAGTRAGAVEARVVDQLIVNYSSFRANTSDRVINDGGGAILADDAVRVAIADSSFTANSSRREGSAVAVVSNDGLDDLVTIERSTFTYNSADITQQRGTGAVFVYSNGYVAILECDFIDNEAYEAGGAYLKTAIGGPLAQRVVIGNSTFAGNEATLRGGAITAFGQASVVVGDSTISNNTVTGAGGVTPESAGGLLISEVGFATILDSTVSGNDAGVTGDGGGLFLYTGLGGVVANSTFSGNRAAKGAGAVVVHDPGSPGTARVENVTIAGNTASVSGGGLELYGSPIAVDFATITANSAPLGGGINVDDSTSAVIDNSIVAGNSGTTGSDVAVGDDTTTFTSTYSLFTSPDAVAGATVTAGSNTFGSPLLNGLADNGGPTLTMLPQWNSPAVEAGDPSFNPPAAPAVLAHDQRGSGYPRKVGTRVNMGAIEGFSAQPPTPPPPTPAGPPRDVEAVAGDAAAVVSWQPPLSSGTFPVTNYRVVSTPAGGSCLVAETTCEIDGLVNGTSYTFEVQALTGAGWGPWSAPSAAVTPEPTPPPPVAQTIVVTGSRGEVRGKKGVIVDGSTTGFSVGAILRPWVKFPGQTSYAEGSASILVDADGGFTWQRRTGKKVYISIRSEDGSVKSKRLVIDR